MFIGLNKLNMTNVAMQDYQSEQTQRVNDRRKK